MPIEQKLAPRQLFLAFLSAVKYVTNKTKSMRKENFKLRVCFPAHEIIKKNIVKLGIR